MNTPTAILALVAAAALAVAAVLYAASSEATTNYPTPSECEVVECDDSFVDDFTVAPYDPSAPNYPTPVPPPSVVSGNPTFTG